MTPWVLLPVKDFARAKTRLAPLFDGPARAEAARQMFLHVLSVVTRAGLPTLVVTDGDAPAKLARAHGAQVLTDPPDAARLGDVVDAGLGHLGARGAHDVLVLMSDLPQLTAADLEAMLAPGAQSVAAPDEAEAGTNALRVRLTGRQPTAFGRADSFARHVALGAAPVRRPGLARDVDLPDHARRWLPR